MLLSRRAKQTATAFAVGWVVEITAVLVVVLLVAGAHRRLGPPYGGAMDVVPLSAVPAFR